MKSVYQMLYEETEKLVNGVERKIVNRCSDLYDVVEWYETMNTSFIKKIVENLLRYDFKRLEEYVKKTLSIGAQLEVIDEGNKFTALAIKKANLSLDQLLNMRLKKPLYSNIRSNLTKKLKEVGIIG